MKLITIGRQFMNTQEKDPDSLQITQDSDPEWVNLWDDCKNKKAPVSKQLTFDVMAKKFESKSDSLQF
jgi:hypothetical protein